MLERIIETICLQNEIAEEIDEEREKKIVGRKVWNFKAVRIYLTNLIYT